jgi:hypothetical protein
MRFLYTPSREKYWLNGRGVMGDCESEESRTGGRQSALALWGLANAKSPHLFHRLPPIPIPDLNRFSHFLLPRDRLGSHLASCVLENERNLVGSGQEKYLM